MKHRVLLLLSSISAVLLLLAACNGETKVTGSSEMRQLSGQVVPVGDLDGSSPAGIEVRVRGLGISTVTDATGAFALVGLPDEAIELSFSGSLDGVDAMLSVGPRDNGLTIELQKKSASTRKRGARSPHIQLEGTVTAISDSSITLLDASRKVEVTCAIVDTTTIRKGNRVLTAADIAVGDRVHVVASPNADETYTAVEIKLQEGEDDGDDDGDDDPAPSKRELEGKVLAIDAASITVMDASTGEQTAAINGDTVIRKGGTPLTTADIKVGDRVHVRAKIEADSSLTALEIMVQNNR